MRPTPPPPRPAAAAAPGHVLDVLGTLWRWRRPILLTTAAAALLAVLIALLLPSYYTATTKFIVVSPDQFSISLLFGGDNRVNLYGNTDDIDRILSVAESDQLIDRMVERFHLYRHYDIDSTKVKAPVLVRREFLSHYSVQRTPRDLVELSVEDKDPEVAAVMARTARDVTDEITLGLLRASQRRTAADLDRAIEQRATALEELNDELTALRSTSGVYNIEAQSEAAAARSGEIEEQFNSLTARIDRYRTQGGRGARDSIAKLEIALAGLTSARATVDSQLLRLNDNQSQLQTLAGERARLSEALTYNRLRAREYAAILKSSQRSIEVVEDARPPVVKSRPIRWLIVVVSTVLGFLFAVLGALLIDGSRRFDWSRVFGRG